jgi:hypothetical protein
MSSSKRADRPWDRKKGIDRFSATPAKSQSGRIDIATSSLLPSPFIEFDGNRFYADRFYLLTCQGNEAPLQKNAHAHPLSSLPSLSSSSSSSCVCGAQQPPPTLDRTRFIQSLDLKAAILGTYTVSPSHVMQLFDHVPTLILHGHKGIEKRVQVLGSHTIKHNHNDNHTVSEHHSPTKKHKRNPNHGGNGAVELPIVTSTMKIKQEEEPPEEAFFKLESHDDDEPIVVPSTMHMTRILTTWIPPHNAATASRNSRSLAVTQMSKGTDNQVIVLDDSDEEHEQHEPTVAFKGIDRAIVKQRIGKRGVHHPKFMLLFEKSGSIVVVISTSNLTEQQSLDGVWVQRFPPVTETTLRRPNIKERRYDGSDFGHVLADFLQKQSDAAQLGEMLPVEFLRHYLSIDSLEAFRDAYAFHTSQVHLIATIPGDHFGRLGVTHLGRKDGHPTFLYGPQRVADIMERLSNPKDQNTKPWIPQPLMSDDDRLILQPTSFGGYWNQPDMANLVKSYMGKQGRDSDVLERMDILWPSYDFIQDVKKEYGSEGTRNVTTTEPERTNGNGGFIFLASQIFNTIDLNIVSRMVQYEHSSPLQVSSLRIPHFKSYARLFEGNDYVLRRDYGVGKAAEIFPWFLMTSACLSRGAQGMPTSDRVAGTDQVSYGNFELGVLFCSRLQGEAESDRVYCWKPNYCACGSTRNKKKLIHLPIPYAVRAQPYQTYSDEAHMCKTPYFHEVAAESACVGLMALTPYGKARAAEQKSGTLQLPNSSVV